VSIARLFRVSPPPPLPLFDAHVNVLPPGTAPPDELNSALTTDEVTSCMNPAGIVCACISPANLPVFSEANTLLRTWANQEQGRHRRWLPMARLGGRWRRPLKDLSPACGVLRAIRWPRAVFAKRYPDVDTLDGFAGVKLAPHASGVPDEEVLEEIARRGLPVLVDSGTMCRPGWIAQRLLPRLRGPVILAHLGSWPCAAELLKESVALASTDDRVYLETSGTSIGNFITYAVGRVPKKLLFGSNAPMCDPAVQWGHVAAAVRDDRSLERIAYVNAMDVFGGPARFWITGSELR
jgi:hypothetical protein